MMNFLNVMAVTTVTLVSIVPMVPLPLTTTMINTVCLAQVQRMIICKESITL